MVKRLKMAEPNVVLNSVSPTFYRDCDDDDFVFVEKTDDDDDDDDADSYDYCDDFCSTISNSTRQEDGDDVYSSSEVNDDEITLRLPGLKDSALTVPLVLLKDLDEAHEAAKLTQITDLDEAVDLISTCSDDEQVSKVEGIALSSPSQDNFAFEKTEERDAGKLENSNVPLSISTSLSKSNSNKHINELAGTDDSSLVLSTQPKETLSSALNRNPASKNTTIILLPAAKVGKLPSSTTPCILLASTKFPQQERKQNDEKHLSCDKNCGTSNAANKATSVPLSISRTSNKKRRKRLKMLKKAQAAEKFQQQAAHASLSSPSQGKVTKKFLKQSKKQLNVTPSRCASKKVANIAVSCAMESMASYREELSRQHGKQ